MIPILIFFAVAIGCLARALWGWLSSGEPFVKRKFAATMIFTLFAVALPTTATMIASNIMVDTNGLISMCFAALIAGWGSDSALKELSKMSSTVATLKGATPEKEGAKSNEETSPK